MNRIDAVVFASELDKRSPSALLLYQSHGWLKAADSIVVAAAAADQNGLVYHVLPAMFALHHGVELFLKGVRQELEGTYSRHHRIADLQAEYSKAIASRPELRIQANIDWLIDWDAKCQRSSKGRSPEGSDFRYILNADHVPSWKGIQIPYKFIIGLSKEYRRDFSRIHRLLFNVKGFGYFWDEGTFAAEYPDAEFWFFCLLGNFSSNASGLSLAHDVVDERGRQWRAYEGEAVNESNFALLLVGSAQPSTRVKCRLRDLPMALGKYDEGIAAGTKDEH